MADSGDEASEGIMMTQAPASAAQAQTGPALTQPPRAEAESQQQLHRGFFIKPQTGCAIFSGSVQQCVLFDGKDPHYGVPVQAGGLVLGRFGEQKRRDVDPTVTVNHEGMQVAAVLAHDPPAPLLVSRRHVLLKVSDDEANLTVENISTTQFVLVKHRGAAHGGGGGKRYELLQTGDKTAVQWGTRLWLGYKNDKLAADPESDAYNNMTWDVMQTKSGKGSNDKKGGKISKSGGKGSDQRASHHAVKAAAELQQPA